MKKYLVLSVALITLFGASFAFGYCNGVCGDINGDGSLDIADLTAFVHCYYENIYDPVCLTYNWACGDVNNDGGTTTVDLQILVDYMFNGGSIDCGN
jgi:hypothetical protein